MSTVKYWLNLYKQISILVIGIGVANLGFGIIQNPQDLPTLATLFRFQSLQDVIYAIVILSLICYALLWVLNGYREIEQLELWLKDSPYQPKSPVLIGFTLFAVGIFFGLLLVYVTNFCVFMGLFTLYVLCDLYLWRQRRVEKAKITTQMMARAETGRAYHAEYKANDSVSSISQRAAAVFKTYYVAKNHYLRVGIELVCLPLFALSYFHLSLPWGISDSQFTTFGYVLLWLAVFIAEVVVFRWRRQMHEGISQLAEERYAVTLQIADGGQGV